MAKQSKLDVAPYIERLEISSYRDRGGIIAELCQLSGWSRDTAYRRLREAGWQSGRRQRRDAGTSSVSEEVLNLAGAITAEAQRKDGRNPSSVQITRAILRGNGHNIPVSSGRLRQLLKERGVDKSGLRKAEPFVRQRSLHPNHVHLVDPSLALIYYTPGGAQRIVHVEENYKNKSHFEGKKVDFKCWRYVLVDHFSGSIWIHYYQSAGENMINLYDFLLRCWGDKDEELANFQGLPQILIWDKGSANTSRPIARALESLGVETWAHKAGAPRAKGSVETMNRHWEGWFETLLRREPVHNVDDMNALAHKFCALYNANAIEDIDSSLRREGQLVGVRAELFASIKPEELRYLPPEEECRVLLTTEPVTVKVDGSLSISHKGYAHKGSQRYALHGQLGIEIGSIVGVQPLLWRGDDSVRVTWRYAGQDHAVELQPLARAAGGFRADSPVIGQEFRSLPHTTQQQRRDIVRDKEMLSRAPLGHSALRQKADAQRSELPQGQQVELPKERMVVRDETSLPVRAETLANLAVRCTVADAAKRLRSILGELPDGLVAHLRATYPGGMTQHDIDLELANWGEKIDYQKAINA